MEKISEKQLEEIKKLYYTDYLCMREIAEKFGLSINTVVYFMRKNNLSRRSFSELNRHRFENKAPSYRAVELKSNRLKELKAIGVMLYWGEGYKSDKGSMVDFANSDPDMIIIFMGFLRDIYKVDESRLRILLYCYSNQDRESLINFWSKLTKIPSNQFSKPYVRKDFNNKRREMKYGLIHIRYGDKKLFLEIKKAINILEIHKIK